MNEALLKTVSTVDAVCETLQDDIFSLRFAPGSKITETDLTAKYGISRNTIREAIAFLLSNGLLEKIANKGVYVKKITGDDLREIFRLRELLEKEAARTIVEIGFIPITLTKAMEEMERVDIKDNWDEYVKADIRFHGALVDAADSPRLSRLYESISAEVKLCIFQSHNIVPAKQENVVQHRLIINALENDDLDEALSILSKHMNSAINNYEAGFLAMEKNGQNKSN